MQAVTDVYEAGPRRLGVRWSRAGIDAELRARVGASAGVAPAPPNLSVIVGERSRRLRTKHQLSAQGKYIQTSGSDAGLVRAILRSLAALALDAAPDAIELDAVLVHRPDGTGALVDRRLSHLLERVIPRLSRGGFRVLDSPLPRVRPSTATALLPDVGVLSVTVADIDRRWPARGIDDPLINGELKIARIVYGGNPEPESTAAVVADMTPLARDATGRVRAADVQALGSLVARSRPTGIVGGDPTALLQALVAD